MPACLRSLSQATAAGALLGSLLAPGCDRPGGRPPTGIVVVCIDTLRTDRLRGSGTERPTTPFLAELARRGTSFPNAQSTSNWTVPSVGSIFTGLRPARHGAIAPGETKHLGVAPTDPNQLASGLETLPEIFRASGYRTALFSGNPYLYGRFRSGFDSATVGRALGREQLPELLSWLDDPSGRPFFLYWQIMDLHQPLEPPERYESLFVRDPPPGYPSSLHRSWAYHDLDPSRAASAEFRRFRELKLALYDGTLRHVDDLVRELVERLTRLGRSADTLVVVTADHGEEFWDHALLPSIPDRDPRGYRGIGHGHTMFQELLHVPLTFVGPGVPARTTVRCPVSLADLLPTLLAAAKLPARSGLDGIDLTPFLRHPLRPCGDRAILSESPAYGPESWALRAGRWKLIRRSGEEPLFFDLARDPRELQPLDPPPAEPFRELSTALERRSRNPVASVVAPRPEELEQELKALGYLH